MKNWYFSLTLLVSYLAVFHAWMHVTQTWVVISGVLVSWCLFGFLLHANSKGYFATSFDLFAHTTVIIDILLEAILNLIHDHYGFYLCALAFSIVVGGYRRLKLP